MATVTGANDGSTVTTSGAGNSTVANSDGNVTVDNTGSGTTTVTGAHNGSVITTTGTGQIVINTALGAGEKVTVNPAGNPNVQITNSGAGLVEVQGDLALDSNDTMTLTLNGDGTTVLSETGTLALGNAPLRLNLASGYMPLEGHAITLIDNDNTDAVVGTFAGLPEGTVVLVNGYQFKISYVGGDGNDVVLTRSTGVVSIAGISNEGEVLTAANTLVDIHGIPDGAISYQWQADGVAISGATDSTFVLTQAQVAKAVNVVASYIDGSNHRESQASAATMVQPASTGSTPLAQQSVVSTVSVTPTDSSTASVVSLALNTGLTGDVISDSVVVSEYVGTAISTPLVMDTPLGLFDLTSSGNTSGGESFSLYVDSALGVNGYWVQNASGTFVNLASAAFGGSTVIEGGKIRLDFTIQDGGVFDTNDAAGTITATGAAAQMELSIIGHAADVPTGGVFF
jgi:hypothetical protein